MDLSYKWLAELSGVDWSPEEMGDRLTLSGTACEHIKATDQYLDKVFVGQVTELGPVEGADKIKKAIVDIGAEQVEVICGAPNVAKGQKIALATVGANVAGGIKIKKAKIRGVVSYGMICSERELGFTDDHSGILVLEEDAPVGTPLADYLDYRDFKMNFELTPNRGDSMCALGVARDLAALGSTTLCKPVVKPVEIAEATSDHISVEINDADACPRYAARIIRNVKMGASPWWVRKKLITAGIRPISNIVDITNLVMIETGQPLHAFDLQRFGSDRVVVRRANDKEKFTTLDGQEHELTPDVLLITNGSTPVAAGGVMGGLSSEVGSDTTDILLEAAYFNPSVIRKSRKHLGFVTESSSRFEKGADPNNIPYAIDRAADLMRELGGGEVMHGIVDCYPETIDPKTISFRPERCNKLLGTDLTTDKMIEIFRALEFDVEEGSILKVTVPTFRPDIEREVDLIEEVVRIVGFEQVPDAVDNLAPLRTVCHYEDTFLQEMTGLLNGAGFDEILNHGLVDSKFSRVINPDLPAVKILNAVSEDLDQMRNNGLQTILEVIKHNHSHRNMDLTLFEVARCYFPPDKNGEWIEEDRLALAVTGNTENGWRYDPRPHDFYDLTGAINKLADHFRWPPLRFEAKNVSYLTDDLSFAIYIGDRQIGMIGEVAKAVLKKKGIKQTILVADLSLPVLIEASDRQIKFENLPVYPAALRDLSLIIDERVRVGDIVEKVKKTGGELARRVDIFDLYTGKQIEAGKKSVAIAISYRSDAGNLEGAEVDKLQAAIVTMLKADFKAEIRDS